MFSTRLAPRCQVFRHIPRIRSYASGIETPQSQKPSDGSAIEKEKDVSPHKTQAELDAELRAKMDGLAGDGGEAGVELEDGQPVSMKRSVKNNMFRYI